MSMHQRPAPPPRVAALTRGDYVCVTYRTGNGPATWNGSVTDDISPTMVRISAGSRSVTVPRKGACFIQLLIPAAERVDITDTVPATPAGHTLTGSFAEPFNAARIEVRT